MIKIGKFKGLPVYKLDDAEWEEKDTKYDNCLYVVGSIVYFHEQVIATLDGNNNLRDFDEDRFFDLVGHNWEKERGMTLERMLARVTNTECAETRPQEDRGLDKRSGERDAANDIVEQFMNSWKDNIDNEIAVLKKAVAQIE